MRLRRLAQSFLWSRYRFLSDEWLCRLGVIIWIVERVIESIAHLSFSFGGLDLGYDEDGF
jgi:hypothetical protein